MKTTHVFLAVCSLLVASAGRTAEANQETVKPKDKTMSTPSVSLGYVVLYVKDVSATLAFYEEAFGLSRRFFNDDNGKAYGELETGAARLAFYSFELAKTQWKQGFVAASPGVVCPRSESRGDRGERTRNQAVGPNGGLSSGSGRPHRRPLHAAPMKEGQNSSLGC